ncbi:MAG TPA: thioesterase family protein [Pyrinomonadaceae bacterium]
MRYAETDGMAIVHHANYLIWFETGRSDLCRQKGFSYREMEDDDSLMLVTEAHIRYRSSAFYDDSITIRTKVAEVRSRSIRFLYEIYRKSDDAILATGETLHLMTNKAKKVKSLPEIYRNKLI